jgi:hypothetical protein
MLLLFLLLFHVWVLGTHDYDLQREQLYQNGRRWGEDTGGQYSQVPQLVA